MARLRHFSFFPIIFLLSLLNASSGTATRRQRYMTGYACEGSQLSISCDQPGQHIQLVRSNFGRFSISICNAHGQLDWSVNCHSPDSARPIADACNGRRNCLLQATTEFLGDPCPGTHKYLEVHYQCVSSQSQPNQITSGNTVLDMSVATTGNQVSVLSSSNYDNLSAANSGVISVLPIFTSSSPPPPPPIIIPTVNPLVKQPRLTESEQSTQSSSLSPSFDSSQHQPVRDVYVSHPYPQDPDSTQISQPQTSIEVQSSSFDFTLSNMGGEYCPSLFARGLAWNRTSAGQVVTQPCPPGSSGIAQWFCSSGRGSSGSGQWLPAQPIFAQCQSSWLAQLKRRFSGGESALLLSAELATLLGEVSQMHGGDVRGVAELLRMLLQPLESLMASNRLQHQKSLTEEMLAVSIWFLFLNYIFSVSIHRL